MKPNFALSLSFDGIRLLHRAAGGWRLVGDVALDATDLPGELATLRKTAAALEPGGVRSKLLLPNEQIKYLTIDTPGMPDAERRDHARIALDGATPYAVSDLAFDISLDGDQTHVAAVAHETLAEAEGFAVEHRFHPVSFAAVPGDQAYLGEPFFGQTAGAADLLEGETVEPDGIAVVVVGTAQIPTGPIAAADAGPEPVAEPAAAAPEPEETTPTDDTAPEVAPLTFRAARAETPPDDGARMPTLGGARRDVPAGENAAPPAPKAQAPAAFSSRRDRREPPPPSHPAPSVTSPSIDTGEDLTQGPPLDPPSAEVAPAPVAAPEGDAPAAAPVKAGFLSRRRAKEPRKPKEPRTPKTKAKAKAAPPIPAPRSAVNKADTEEDRMTIFGARKGDVGGKPRFLGLMLTAALLLFLAGVAAWAAVFMDEGTALSRLFGDRSEPERAFSDPQPEVPVLPAPAEPEVVDTRTASLDPALSEEDSAVLEALRAPVEPPAPEVLSEAELEAKYAATGIWTRAPVVPDAPAGLVTLDDLYLTSIDPVSTAADAVALPRADELATDAAFAALPNPAAPGTDFALDDRGLVRPAPDGALSPDGILVYLGRPAVVPPATPTRFAVTPEDTTVQDRLAGFRPKERPGNLVETYERGQFGGLTRDELAGYRPEVRPQSLQERAAAEAAAQVEPINTDDAVETALATPSAFENPTRLATTASARPDTRPRNFARIVRRAERAKPKEEEVRVASAASVAPRAVTPKIPSSASVSRAATTKNALNLRKVNLIGVYGKPSARRALVRLGNGRYRKVVVGDRLDGGRVSAIGDGELRYRKGSRNLVLKMPKG